MEQEIAKGIFLQTKVKSSPFSTITLSVLMVIVILLKPYFEFNYTRDNRYLESMKIASDDTQELLLGPPGVLFCHNNWYNV